MSTLVGQVCTLVADLHRGPLTFPKGTRLVYEGNVPDDYPRSSTGIEFRFGVKKDGRIVHLDILEVEVKVHWFWGKHLVTTDTFEKLLGAHLL